MLEEEDVGMFVSLFGVTRFELRVCCGLSSCSGAAINREDQREFSSVQCLLWAFFTSMLILIIWAPSCESYDTYDEDYKQKTGQKWTQKLNLPLFPLFFHACPWRNKRTNLFSM